MDSVRVLIIDEDGFRSALLSEDVAMTLVAVASEDPGKLARDLAALATLYNFGRTRVCQRVANRRSTSRTGDARHPGYA